MYREDKATQLAARFINLKGGRIEYLHLLKLMYEADKQSSLKYGLPITFDTWTAMQRGPVLSTTYDILRQPGTRDGYWQTYIQKQGYDLVITNDPGDDELSEGEEEIITGVFNKYGVMDQWAVVTAMHELPEWKEEWNHPDFTTSELDYEYVLRANGASQIDIETMKSHLETQHLMGIFETQPTVSIVEVAA